MPFVKTFYRYIYWLYFIFVLSLLIMWNRRGACRVSIGKPRARDQLEDLGVDGGIILKWIFKKWNGGHGVD
jgi:hypothetical protein